MCRAHGVQTLARCLAEACTLLLAAWVHITSASGRMRLQRWANRGAEAAAAAQRRQRCGDAVSALQLIA
jgi:hypothetical protein